MRVDKRFWLDSAGLSNFDDEVARYTGSTSLMEPGAIFRRMVNPELSDNVTKPAETMARYFISSASLLVE